MGIVFIDGFDHYTTSEMDRKYTFNGINSGMGAGRVTGQALRVTTTSYCEKVFSTTSQAWRISFAIRIASQTGAAFNLFQLRDGVSGQVELSLSNGRVLYVSRNGTQVGSAGTTTLALNAWYHVEWYVSIKDSISSGNCQVRLNGVQELNLAAGLDLKNTANTTADRFRISGQGFWDFYLDDLVVSQEADTTTPTFLGDRRIVTLYPSGNGNYSQFTGSDGNSTDNYALVDDPTISEADYVTSDVVGHKDSYEIGNLPVTPSSIDAVQISANIRKDDAGTRTAKTFFRIDGTDYESSEINPSTSFQVATHIATTNPATGTAWTVSDINNLEAGVKVES